MKLLLLYCFAQVEEKSETFGVMMSGKEQIDAFASDLDKLIERYRLEFELTYAAVIGVLFLKAHLLCDESTDVEDDEPTH